MPIVNAKTTFLLKAQNFKKVQKNVMIVSLFQIILKSILRFWSFRYVKEVLAFFFLLYFPPSPSLLPSSLSLLPTLLN